MTIKIKPILVFMLVSYDFELLYRIQQKFWLNHSKNVRWCNQQVMKRWHRLINQLVSWLVALQPMSLLPQHSNTWHYFAVSSLQHTFRNLLHPQLLLTLQRSNCVILRNLLTWTHSERDFT